MHCAPLVKLISPYQDGVMGILKASMNLPQTVLYYFVYTSLHSIECLKTRSLAAIYWTHETSSLKFISDPDGPP